jgi:hypothetical protein
VVTFTGKDLHAADRVDKRLERLVLLLWDCSVIGFSDCQFVNVGITVSLGRKNSPKLERWCRYTPGVVSDRSKDAPLGSGLLHRSRW